MSKYIVVVDQGTTSTRVIIFDKKYNEILNCRRALKQSYPKNGWVEHNPDEIIYDIIDMFQEVAEKISLKEIIGISITNQRETTVLWDKLTGEPVYPAIVWQDRRTQGYCLAMSNDHVNSIIQRKTGLLLDPYFCATKINWILNNVSGLKQRLTNGNLLFGTIDTYLIWKLTGGASHVTDVTNASRTLLFNINSAMWDGELLDMFKIPTSILPKVLSNDEPIGNTDKNVLGESIPIIACIGDQQSAAIGQGCINKGDVKCTLGTGSFLVLNTGKNITLSRQNLISTIAYKINNEIFYAIEGSVFMAGAIVQWLRDKLELLDSSKESEALARSINGNSGVYMVPAFTGLGAPYWLPSAKASILGMTRDTGKAQIVRAGLEAVAYQINDIVKLMQLDFKLNLSEIKVDGGMAANSWLLQFMADILNANIDRACFTEATAYGALFLGAVNCGWEPNLEIAISKRTSMKTYKPIMEHEHRQKLICQWDNAVESTILHSNEATVELV
ncbi:MAG: glycerol kinase GlpK [Francisellaceae bacterium]|jgi:glycerol kinase|nr:glycerol kinase GlpK [Francisellaceae bacterium]MBT6207361.1 glycerol kinase GlpK [Francisellaceae bacterium]MBT6538836.1 glycerol kinase GlpK [Francisellaceae bacterium]